ncbi:sterol desaturase family protein [Simiduia sp. 21SJ11W-1]|uniref:sterol desaturase family protein n=1 Tax=Simiduia sp. 21SJ11W-1 TaxID=2909669 RepID=UPI0020A124C8|nr:sterol desaturase family protein [Simiduia sp. 21SJ11W-1]UTA47466.1 sterol desaturase family protein [Simiduia sp. 21SJ11W-1]
MPYQNAVEFQLHYNDIHSESIMAELITVLAAPLYLILIGWELWVDKRRGTGFYRLNDAIASMSLGVISRTHRLVVFAVGTYIFTQVLPTAGDQFWRDNLWLAWLVAFIGYDLTYYWNHRLNHEINCLWAGHVVHHQSEDYNLTTALRQSSGGVFDWIFSIPLYLTGIPADIIIASAGLNLIYQFWVHTQHINRLGWMEKWFVTPSHHRVHHAQNPLYWDKNYGGVLIVWDKLFNTFQAERDDTPIIYGVSRPLNTMNPLKANLQVWWYLLRDALYCKSLWDKCRIWFMPTGWRPADMEARIPIAKTDLASFQKFNPEVAGNIKIYALFQFTAAFLLGFSFIFMFSNETRLITLLAAWLFVTLPLISTGHLLDGGSAQWELVRLGLSALIFGLCINQLPGAPYSQWFAGGYLLLNLGALVLLMKPTAPQTT